MEERTSEIYKRMKNKKEEEERQAEEADKKQEIVWREQGMRINTNLNLKIFYLIEPAFYFKLNLCELHNIIDKYILKI